METDEKSRWKSLTQRENLSGSCWMKGCGKKTTETLQD